MAYRKVIVNNIEYEYTIGKSFLKVKGVGVVNTIDKYDIITPVMVVEWIKEKIAQNEK
jgi:hypothetical protein